MPILLYFTRLRQDIVLYEMVSDCFSFAGHCQVIYFEFAFLLYINNKNHRNEKHSLSL